MELVFGELTAERIYMGTFDGMVEGFKAYNTTMDGLLLCAISV